MKKIYTFIAIIVLVLGLTACSSELESIEGYWMAENGETISFNSDGKVIIDGISLSYSVYNENNLSISFWGFAEEYRFNLEKDILTLTDLSSNSKIVYYRDEDKQTEIQENLNKIREERAEQERLQQELHVQAQVQKDYEQYITKLKNRIESIDKEIPRIQGYISDNEGYIAESNQDIQEELDTIAELETEIAQLQHSTEEIAQGDIEYLRGTQEYHYGNIEYYNGKIDYYNNKITWYQQEITELEAEKEEIITELTKLGEY